jgi:hypothetical protein
MTQEIVDAVKALEQEKGIASDTLMDALQDALLSAYKKTPGAAKYARVELDHATADFRVYELMVPEDLEKRLLDEQFEDQIQAAEAAEAAGEPVPEIEITKATIDPETGERREPAEPELELERLEPYRDQIETRDVTPDDFGRIAAQTAKQVILQRIREAERGMMFEEYKDRVGELVTGIIQQSDNRYTLVQLRERVEALLPHFSPRRYRTHIWGLCAEGLAAYTNNGQDDRGPRVSTANSAGHLGHKSPRPRHGLPNLRCSCGFCTTQEIGPCPFVQVTAALVFLEVPFLYTAAFLHSSVHFLGFFHKLVVALFLKHSQSFLPDLALAERS